MMKRFCFYIVLILMSVIWEQVFATCSFNEPSTLYIGPEIYYLRRDREGGSWQRGWLFGGRALYERRKSFGFYWAAEGYYAHGIITGKSSSGSKLKSHLTEAEAEARLGFSLCFRICPKFSFTPYGGYGGFYCKNNFKHPSPLPCIFRDSFEYALAGFITSMRFNTCLEASIDFKAKYMLDGQSNITHDPDNESVSLKMNNELQYELAIPINYNCCWKGRLLKITIAPFYRFRHFGGMLNYPYDFIDTKFRSYGGRVLFYLSY
jgi:hypothetical protein